MKGFLICLWFLPAFAALPHKNTTEAIAGYNTIVVSDGGIRILCVP